MQTFYRAMVVLALCVVSFTSAARAAQDGDILLTITTSGADPVVHELTRSDLEAIGETQFETQTIWTTGPQVFSGVSLLDLVAHFGLTGNVLKAQAINDYIVEVPLTDAVAGGPIIAYSRNGKSMSVRSKGPLWIVYPYDSREEYRTEAIYSRSIWQLDRIEVSE